VITLDVRADLPLADWQLGSYGPKLSRTFHWNGPALPIDVAAMDLIMGDANYHLSKDWSPEPGIQGGDGIMYHKLIALDGTLFITRDPDAMLWACGNQWGNMSSEHVQVMCGVGQVPTPEQWATMGELSRSDPKPTFPHRYWSATECPGDEIATWVENEGWKEDDMDREVFKQWLKEDVWPTIDAMKDAYNPCVVYMRTNGLLDAEQQTKIDEALARLDKLRTI
jgi:hypothetical protein